MIKINDQYNDYASMQVPIIRNNLYFGLRYILKVSTMFKYKVFLERIILIDFNRTEHTVVYTF